MKTRVEVHIDRLVLNGWPESSVDELKARLEAELAQRFEHADDAPEHLAASSLELRSESHPGAIAHEVAQSIVGSATS